MAIERVNYLFTPENDAAHPVIITGNSAMPTVIVTPEIAEMKAREMLENAKPEGIKQIQEYCKDPENMRTALSFKTEGKNVEMAKGAMDAVVNTLCDGVQHLPSPPAKQKTR